MTSPVSAVEAIEKAQNRVQGMVRSIDHYRNGDPKAVADGSYAQVLYALTDYKHDILVLWAFAVDAARQAEALKRENAEVAKAVLEVLDAVRDYLPPDGISARDCLSRVISAVDNSAINPLIKKLEHINVDA